MSIEINKLYFMFYNLGGGKSISFEYFKDMITRIFEESVAISEHQLPEKRSFWFLHQYHG